MLYGLESGLQRCFERHESAQENYVLEAPLGAMAIGAPGPPSAGGRGESEVSPIAAEAGSSTGAKGLTWSGVSDTMIEGEELWESTQLD